ncbi:hypothetical protein, partial [Neisseria gonorrhoeae]|uniref:hypothetical protein n=1 Tax=Neisseria gonorrhoeae TaxID=485 RepID=UPI00201DEC65
IKRRDWLERKRSSERVFQTTFSVSGICFAVSGILRFAAWFLQVVCLIINILIRMQRNRTP